METRNAATIHTSEALTVRSENNGQEYRISVSLPASYDHKPETTFPVVYVMDGNVLFEMVTGIGRLMQMGGLMPEVIVVAVGYPLEEFYGADYQQFFTRRAKDLTSVRDERYEQFVRKVTQNETLQLETGSAESFRKFVTGEVTALVEGRYRASAEDKTLLGYSTGGHFAVYAMLRQPRSFQRYIIGSPSLGFGDGALFELETAYAAEHKELPVKLFLAIGEQEQHPSFSPSGYLGTIISVSDFYRFAAILQERGYESLQFSKRLFKGFDHTDVIGPTVAAGLRNVFAEK